MKQLKKKKLVLKVRVSVRSQKSEIVGCRGDTWLIRLRAAPEKNRANIELVKLLRKKFNLSNEDIHIISGCANQTKLIEITNLDKKTFASLLKT